MATYEAERAVEVLKIQNAARNSTEWFEHVDRYAVFDAEQFAYSLLTRSQRISHENLRLRDRAFVTGMETWFSGRAGGERQAVPPMFTPFTLRGVTLRNRVVVSPMAQYSCRDGTPDDYYLVHLGSRAHGGAGLVFTEMVCVAPDARITPGCAGLYSPEHVAAWRHIVDYVHARTGAKIALQLGHAGPKGSTQLGWEASDEPLPAGNWPLLAPSAIPYGPTNQVPHAMNRADMDRVTEEFVRATRGRQRRRLRLARIALRPRLSALRVHLPADQSARRRVRRLARESLPLSAGGFRHDARGVARGQANVGAHFRARLGTGGNTPDDAVAIARLFKAEGADLIDVSSGQTTRQAQPVYGRMYQTPFADRVRNETGIATMAVGAIFEPDHVNSILMAGRADLCALGRPHLADPYWTLHAAAQLGYRDIDWPVQYGAGRDQLERNLARAALLANDVPEANG